MECRVRVERWRVSTGGRWRVTGRAGGPWQSRCERISRIGRGWKRHLAGSRQVAVRRLVHLRVPIPGCAGPRRWSRRVSAASDRQWLLRTVCASASTDWIWSTSSYRGSAIRRGARSSSGAPSRRLTDLGRERVRECVAAPPIVHFHGVMSTQNCVGWMTLSGSPKNAHVGAPVQPASRGTLPRNSRLDCRRLSVGRPDAPRRALAGGSVAARGGPHDLQARTLGLVGVERL